MCTSSKGPKLTRHRNPGDSCILQDHFRLANQSFKKIDFLKLPRAFKRFSRLIFCRIKDKNENDKH